MPRSPMPLGTISLDSTATAPLYRQLYDALRAAILEGRLIAGARLPSSRQLAADLGVGRNTVLAAYEQLTAEGYLEGRVGAGTRVAASLPENLLEVGASRRRDGTRQSEPRITLSRRGEAMASVRRRAAGYDRAVGPAFQHGLPAIDEFPAAVWSRLLARRTRDPRSGFHGYETGAGFRPLREAIAVYAGAARGVVCTPDQVIVTAGAQGALDLAARMVIDPGDRVWVEEPGYLGARGAFLGAGARLVPVPVDADGLDIEAGIAAEENPRLIYVTPSHQFLLGVTLSLQRRLSLLEFARKASAWIIEDDYDSEYRYTGRPIASLQGLDRSARTLYMGTFAKTLFPALRVGYLIVPDALVDPFSAAIRISGHTPPAAIQAALADFMGEGHFGAHIRRMLGVYAERRACLLAALDGELSDFLVASPSEGGIQIAGLLRGGLDDKDAAKAAAENGIRTTPLSTYYLGASKAHGLHLGYAAIPEPTIRKSANRLARALEKLAGGV